MKISHTSCLIVLSHRLVVYISILIIPSFRVSELLSAQHNPSCRRDLKHHLFIHSLINHLFKVMSYSWNSLAWLSMIRVHTPTRAFRYSSVGLLSNIRVVNSVMPSHTSRTSKSMLILANIYITLNTLISRNVHVCVTL